MQMLSRCVWVLIRCGKPALLLSEEQKKIQIFWGVVGNK